MAIEDGGSAFPEVFSTFDDARGMLTDVYSSGGMTLRDFFAATIDVPWDHVRRIVSQQVGGSFTTQQVIDCRAQLRYAEADAMIAARERPAVDELATATPNIAALDRCTFCEGRIDKSMSFCPGCGADLRENQSAPVGA